MNHPADQARREWQFEGDLAEDILNYFAEHPQAMDTLRGIAEWWLMRQQVRVVVERVARVLEQLVKRGVLEQIGTGAGAQYRLNQGRLPAKDNIARV
jgi:hypothetical protein